MITKNLSTLKINKLTQAQYDAAIQAGTINEDEIYMTPDNNELDTTQFLRVSDEGSAVQENPINADTLEGKSASDFPTKAEVEAKAPLASPTFTGTPKTSANTSYTTAQLRNVILSTADPTSSDGNNGDIWIKYKA